MFFSHLASFPFNLSLQSPCSFLTWHVFVSRIGLYCCLSLSIRFLFARVQVAMEAADMVLVRSDVCDVVSALHLGRTVRECSCLSFVCAIVSNRVFFLAGREGQTHRACPAEEPSHGGEMMCLELQLCRLRGLICYPTSPSYVQPDCVRVSLHEELASTGDNERHARVQEPNHHRTCPFRSSSFLRWFSKATVPRRSLRLDSVRQNPIVGSFSKLLYHTR